MALRSAGVQTLTVTDLAQSTMTGTSAAVAVRAGAAVALRMTGPSTPVTSGQRVSVSITAVDAYGNVATDYRGVVAFSSNDAQATLAGNTAFSAQSAGVLVVQASFGTAGSNSLSVIDTQVAALQATLSGIVTQAGALTQLELTNLPASLTAGQTSGVTVRARDAHGNTATGFSGVVRLTSTDAQAALPADYSFGASDAGVHAFGGIVLKTAGAQTLTAAVLSTAVTGSQSTAVQAASIYTLRVGGLSDSVAGQAASLTVAALDAYGNTATGYTGTVHFTSTDGQAALPTDYSFVAANNGSKTFPGGITLKTAGTQSVTATDLANSGLTDTRSGLLVSAASTVKLSVSGAGTSLTAGQMTQFLVAATDAYGNVTAAYRGTVHVSSTDARALLPADYTFVPGDNGQHTFAAGVTFKTAASQTLTATDTATASINGQQSGIAVSPAAAATLTLSGLPSTMASGQISSALVQARDAYNNLATGYLGTVHFTSTDAAANLPSDAAFTPGDAGSKTLSVTLHTAGTRSVTVTDTANGALTATQSNLTVNAVGAAKLMVLGATGGTAGTATSVTVRAVDGANNLVTTYTGTVHFTSSDAQAGLPGNYAFVAGDAGQHTFTGGVTLKTAGSQSITATDITTSITGSQTGINVTPGSTKQLLVSGLTATTAGSAQTATVRAVDAYANTTPAYAGTVHLTSSDAQAVLPTNYAFVAGDAGQHAFSGVILKTAGSRSVTATDTGNGSINGTQSGINISAASVATLQISGITNGVAGAGNGATVKAIDAYGNTATTYTGTVHFTSNDAQATLPANYAFVAGDAGQHAFAGGIVLKTAGSRSVDATDTVTGSLTGSQSGIVVTAAAAVGLTVTGLTNSTAGAAQGATVRAVDTYGNTGTGYTGTVQFTSSDAQALLPANYTFVAGDSGQHTFAGAVTFKTSGTQSLTCQDTVTGSIVGVQNGVTVSPAAAASLLLVGITNGAAGSPRSATVTAKDTYGNTATGYTGTVTLTSTDAQASLPGNYTFALADGGVHAFTNTVVLKSAGAQSVTARDTVTGSINGTQAGISVTAGSAASFVVNGFSASPTAGVSGTVAVTAKDAYNNTVTGYTGTVQLTSSDANATLQPNYTYVASDSGVHSLSATLVTAGTQSLTATDTVTSSCTGTQSGIVVAAAAATTLRVAGYPSAVTAGQIGSVTVTAKDTYNNTATGYTGTVHFTSSDAQATLPPDATLISGTKTFSNTVALKTAGSRSLVATDTASSSVTGSQTATVSAGALSATVSTLTASPNALLPSNATTLSAVAMDAYSNILAGQSVVLSISDTDCSFGTSSGSTNASGVFSGTMTCTKAGLKAPKATLGSAVLTGSVRYVQVVTNATPVAYISRSGNTASTGNYITAADVDKDNKQDMIVSETDNGVIIVSRGVGNGTFNAPASYTVGDKPRMVRTADLNKDGYLDIAVTSDHNMTVLLNNGAGAYTNIKSTSIGSAQGFGIAIADYNGDGNQNIAIAGPSSYIGVFIGRGNGTFQTMVTYPITNSGTGLKARADISAGDLNGDGRPDLAVSIASPSGIYTFLNKGDGTFYGNVAHTATVDGVDVQLADINGDGFIDALTSDNSNLATILLGDGAGNLAAGTQYQIGNWPCAYAVADFNGDGMTDMQIASFSSSEVYSLVAVGSGNFPSAVATSLGSDGRPWDIVTQDFNGDGKPDVAVSTTAYDFVVVLNTTP